MPKTTKGINDYVYKDKTPNLNELWFSQSEIEGILRLHDDAAYDKFALCEQEIHEHNKRKLEQLQKRMLDLIIDRTERFVEPDDPVYWLIKVRKELEKGTNAVFAEYGLVDTNKVAGEETPSQACGLRETKEGEIPSKPNNKRLHKKMLESEKRFDEAFDKALRYR